MRILLIVIFYFLVSVQSFSQTRIDSNFRSVQSGSEIPQNFKEISEFFMNVNNYDKSKHELLSTDSRYFIYELFARGDVLFDEKCSNYVNEIANYVLKDNVALRKELSFFVLKSNHVNAFCTDPGIIFVTTGLLAQIENEAQLAFIIAHEINHHSSNHIKNKFELSNKIAIEEDEFKHVNPDEKISLMSSYDKNQEFEADKKAIQLLLKSEYDIGEVTKSFQMLLYSYLPYGDSKFLVSFLNRGPLEIPARYLDTETKPILGIADYDDGLQSHPNLEKRISNADNLIGVKESKGNLKFKISENTFHEVQLLARLEGINLLLADRKYDRALYNVFILSKDYPSNAFLEMSKIKALYGMTVYKNNDRFDEVSTKYQDSEGEISILNFLLDTLTKEQLNVIAYRHTYDAYVKYPYSETIRLYENRMRKELALSSGILIETLQGLSYDEYSKIVENGVGFSIEDSIKNIENSDLTKYQKVKAKQRVEQLAVGPSLFNEFETKFHLFALADIVSGNSLKEKLLLLVKEEEEKSNTVYYRLAPKNKDNGFHLGLKNVAIVSPMIAIISRKNKLETFESCKFRNEIFGYYDKDYNKLNIQKSNIDLWDLSRSIIHYDHVSIVKRWFNEILSHGDLGMISSSHDQMQEVSESLGTSHFLFTSVIIDKKKKRNVFLSLSIDANKDQAEFFQINKSNSKLNGKPLEMCVFNVLYQLNR